MHGRILIVDPIATNRIVLKVKLSTAYYDVIQASSIVEAIAVIEQAPPDVVITSGQLEDGTAGDLAQKLRAHPKTNDVPIIAIETCQNGGNRLDFLASGVDAILGKPLNDTLLLARVRSLVRAHAADSEWRLHEDTSRALGFAEQQSTFVPNATALFVGADQKMLTSWMYKIKENVTAKTSIAAVDDALDHLDGPIHNKQACAPDVFILAMDRSDPQKFLHLLATLKSHFSTRHSKILVLQTHPDQSLGAQALDMGANDLILGDIDPDELTLRINALIERKHVGDQMRANVRNGLEAAIYDPLTGLHNRRYAMPHLERIAKHAVETEKPFAIMIADMDHFKQINDSFGHAAGDAVLVELAKRLRQNLRAVDLIARIGGEEFMIVLPGAPLAKARNAARRLVKLIGETPFEISAGRKPITATISVGLAIGGTTQSTRKTAHQLIDEADKALYRSKLEGRNCVTLSRPAA